MSNNTRRKRGLKPYSSKDLKGIDNRIKAYNIQAIYRDYLISKEFVDKETGRLAWGSKSKKDFFTFKEFDKIVKTCNTLLVNTMCDKDMYFRMPYGQGELNFIKYEITPEYIDFLYQKTKGSVYIPEIGKETKYRIKINYNRLNARTYTSQFYTFNPTSYFKKKIKHQLENTELGHRLYSENHK